MASRIITLLAALLLCAGCSNHDAETEKAAPPPPAAEAAKPAPPPVAPAVATPTAQAEPAPKIDPSRVPVEEDFAKDAEAQISKNANLPVEIRRLAGAIEKAKSQYQ